MFVYVRFRPTADLALAKIDQLGARDGSLTGSTPLFVNGARRCGKTGPL